jgi:probable phosphoglycerate mutase
MCEGVGSALCGRAPGVHLNAEGREQAAALAEQLRDERLHAVYCSPLERARETAAAIAAPHGLTPCIEPGLNEIDFGEWTGRTIRELQQLSRFRAFNEHRSTTRVPGGELMLEVQARVVAAIDSLCARHPGHTVLAVSHGDVIKAALAHYLRVSLDHLSFFEIAPACVSALEVQRSGARMSRLNDASSPLALSLFHHHRP